MMIHRIAGRSKVKEVHVYNEREDMMPPKHELGAPSLIDYIKTAFVLLYFQRRIICLFIQRCFGMKDNVVGHRTEAL